MSIEIVFENQIRSSRLQYTKVTPPHIKHLETEYNIKRYLGMQYYDL